MFEEVQLEETVIKKKTGRPLGKKDSKPRKRKRTGPTKEQLLKEKRAKNKEVREEYGNTPIYPRGVSKSKMIQKLKDSLADFLSSDEEIEMLKNEIHAMKDPKDRIWARKELMQFVLPKVSSTELSANLDVTSVGDELELLTRSTAAAAATIAGAIPPPDEEVTEMPDYMS